MEDKEETKHFNWKMYDGREDSQPIKTNWRWNPEKQEAEPIDFPVSATEVGGDGVVVPTEMLSFGITKTITFKTRKFKSLGGVELNLHSRGLIQARVKGKDKAFFYFYGLLIRIPLAFIKYYYK